VKHGLPQREKRKGDEEEVSYGCILYYDHRATANKVFDATNLDVDTMLPRRRCGWRHEETVRAAAGCEQRYYEHAT